MSKLVKTTCAMVGAIMLLWAVPAIASAGSVFVADEYPATLNTDSGEFVIRTEVPYIYNACRQEMSGSLEAAATTVSTTSGETKNCSLQMNSCHFELKPGTGAVDIGPSNCGGITWLGYPTCKMTILPGSLSATYSNVKTEAEKNGVKFHVEGTNLKYKLLENGYCGEAGSTHEGLSIEGSWVLSATNAAKKAENLYSVANGEGLGLQMVGEGEEGGNASRLQAQAYPARITGTAKPKSGEGKVEAFKFGSRIVECESGSAAGSTISADASSFKLLPSFTGCSIAGIGTATVKANYCFYTLSGFNSVKAGSYTSDNKLECLSGSENLEVSLPSIGCTLKVPSQQFTNDGATLVDEGSLRSASVNLTLAGSGLTYTQSGGGCFLLKVTGSDGSVGTLMNLGAVYAG